MAESRTHPKTSSPFASLCEQRSNAGGPFLQPRRLRREEVFRHATTRGSHDALAHEAGQSTVIVGTKGADRLESRPWTASVHDQDGRATLDAVGQGAEIVFALVIRPSSMVRSSI